MKGLEKRGLQLPPPSMELHTSLTQASLTTTKANKVGKETQRGESPHHLSFKNFTLCPFPTSKESLLLTTCHSLLIAFHNPTPYPPLTSLEHQPPCSSPNFPMVTWFQKNPSLSSKSPAPFAQKRLIESRERLYPQPPFTFVWANQTPPYKMRFRLKSPTSPQKIPLNLFYPQSNHSGQRKHRHQVNGHARQSALNQGDPPLEMYWLFHLANFFLNLSSTPSQTTTYLWGAPKSNPR